jgi:hypothetical protein
MPRLPEIEAGLPVEEVIINRCEQAVKRGGMCIRRGAWLRYLGDGGKAVCPLGACEALGVPSAAEALGVTRYWVLGFTAAVDGKTFTRHANIVSYEEGKAAGLRVCAELAKRGLLNDDA